MTSNKETFYCSLGHPWWYNFQKFNPAEPGEKMTPFSKVLGVEFLSFGDNYGGFCAITWDYRCFRAVWKGKGRRARVSKIKISFWKSDWGSGIFLRGIDWGWKIGFVILRRGDFVLWSLVFSFLKLNTLFSSARIRLYVALVLPLGAGHFPLLFVGAESFPPFVQEAQSTPPRRHFPLTN